LVFSIAAKNISQAPELTQTIAARVTNANTGLYTVPAGKIARVASCTMTLDAVGADALYTIAMKRGATFTPLGVFVATNGSANFTGSLLLVAGDIITNVGNNGSTNGTCDQTVTFREYDA